MTRVSGNIVDVLNAEIFPGTLLIAEGRIKDIVRDDKNYPDYLIPGFIDAHMHIESSMLVPSEFARIAAIHGTVATVSDPHEIANVLGLEGIDYMIENARSVPVRFHFGAPSCVPAAEFETSGATLGVNELEELLKTKEIHYLAEVMNFPGVIHDNPEVHEKIRLAHKYGKPIDGHAPGLRGNDLKKYIDAGITTDHETLSREEALEKIRLGMKILIREGSAAKNFEELITLVDEYPEWCMFCSDDKHPDELVQGHINEMVKRAARLGIDHMKVLRAACVNPVLHYGMDAGLLRNGDNADFLVVDNLRDFTVLKTFIRGEIVAESGRALIPRSEVRLVNLIIEHKGGICAVSRDREMILPLPVAGIMSNEEYTEVAEKYSSLDRMAKELGSILHAPFMTLSFMALPVIPKLKLTDKGLFDAEEFRFVDLFMSD